MANVNDPDAYSIKEMLTLLREELAVHLDKIEAKLDAKSDTQATKDLELRVKGLEEVVLRPDTVRQLIAESLNDSQAKGLTRRHAEIALAGMIVIFINLALSVVALILHIGP